MPELAEVEHARRQWGAARGQRILSVRVHRRARIFRDCPVRLMEDRLPGMPLGDSLRSGKQLLFRFGPHCWLGIHLGMTGRLSVRSTGGPAGKHDHLLLVMEKAALVFTDPRLFGKVGFDESAGIPEWWSRRPPEILSAAFTPGAVAAFLHRRPRTPLKAVLLMQERFPGIGNWMADEILWRAGIHPATPAGRLDKGRIHVLWKECRWVCRRALTIIGEGRGEPGPKGWPQPPRNWLFQHRWEDGGTCPKTGKPLVRGTIGGRTTCWSPARQKLPPG